MLLELHITIYARASYSDMPSDVIQRQINGKVISMKAGQILVKRQACFATDCTWILKAFSEVVK
jgi:hypothetical protein